MCMREGEWKWYGKEALRGQLSNSPFSIQQSRSLLSDGLPARSSLRHLPLSALSSVCLSHLNTPTPSAFLLIITVSSFPCDLLCNGVKVAEGAKLPGNQTISIFFLFFPAKGHTLKMSGKRRSRERPRERESNFLQWEEASFSSAIKSLVIAWHCKVYRALAGFVYLLVTVASQHMPIFPLWENFSVNNSCKYE